MLPDRRKNLIIFIVGIILFIVLVFSIFGISNYVKKQATKRVDPDVRSSSKYPTEYAYYGVTLDAENIYRIYGITEGYNEKYIGVRSFYKIQDYLVKDNRLLMYSDGCNELRYDGANKEFYLYRFDDLYSNNYKAKLSKNNLIYVDKENNSFIKGYGKEESTELFQGIKYENIIVAGNIIYYSDDVGIYRYNINGGYKESMVSYADVSEKIDIKLLEINDNYLIYRYNGELCFYNLKSPTIKSLSELNIDDKEISYLTSTNDGFYFLVKNEGDTYSIKKYNLINNYVEEQVYITKYLVKNMVAITNELYYMDIVMNGAEESILFSTRVQDIVKKLENKYLYITALEDNYGN